MPIEPIIEKLLKCPECGAASYRCTRDDRSWHCETCRRQFSESD